MHMFFLKMAKLVEVVLLFLFCGISHSVELPEKWKVNIRTVITIHERAPYLPQVILPSSLNLASEPALIPFIPLLPPVIVWDVMSQNRHFLDVSGASLICFKCGNNLLPKCWNIGQNCFSNPRLLHDFDSVVLLIGRVYRCSNNHEYLSYCQSVLNSVFPTGFQFPFHIQHKVGFVLSFLQLVITLAEKGLGHSEIVDVIGKSRAHQKSIIESSFWRELLWYKQNNVAHLPEYAELCSIVKNWKDNKVHAIIPSRFLITSLFATHFFRSKEDFYINKMTTLCCQNSISLEHTFKVAANLGYQRSDGKWVTQYKALFLILNEDGQVLSWQFTKTKSFDEVKILIVQVCKRVFGLRRNVSTIYIDDCCNWRQKLQSSLHFEVAV